MSQLNNSSILISCITILSSCTNYAPTFDRSNLLLPSERSESSGGTGSGSLKEAPERDIRSATSIRLEDQTADGGVVPSMVHCRIEEIVGHCITNMGTACIEYHNGDANVLKEECGKTGMPTGWFVGACGDEGVVSLASSNGGCYDGDLCLTRFSFPLGGKAATDATRLDYKSACISSGMNYVSLP